MNEPKFQNQQKHGDKYDDEFWTNLKLAINKTIWEQAPGYITLDIAEEAAAAAFSIIYYCGVKEESGCDENA